MTEPGSVHHLDLRYIDDDWKAAPLSWSRKRQNAKDSAPVAAASGDKPGDTRTPRSAEPVYQTADDAAAAALVDWETQCLACIGLVPPDAPTP